MHSIRLATRYAKSLLDFAVEKGKLEEVYQDQLYLKKLMEISREFRVVLSSPVISSDKKLKIIESVTKGKVGELTMTFFKLITRKKRDVFLKDIVDSFLRQYDVFSEITQVRLTIAAPMDKTEIDKLISKVKVQAQLKNVKLTTEIDESLIGGFILRYGDKRYDASISKNLGIYRKGLENNEYLKNLR